MPKQKLIALVGDPKITTLLENKFSNSGFQTVTATDLISAQIAIRNKKPDLVILNIAPGANMGFELLESLKAEGLTPKLPVIIIVYSKKQEELDKAFALGVRDYMTQVKFDLDELLNKVTYLLNIKDMTAKTNGDHNPQGSVLVVEDDTFLLDLMEKKFKKSQIETHRATDVDQARSVLKNSKIDVILLDMILPGMNGMDFLKEIKKDPKFKKIPVIITSNLGQSEEVKQGLDAGAVEYLVKAYTMPGEILDTLRKYLPKK